MHSSFIFFSIHFIVYIVHVSVCMMNKHDNSLALMQHNSNHAVAYPRNREFFRMAYSMRVPIEKSAYTHIRHGVSTLGNLLYFNFYSFVQMLRFFFLPFSLTLLNGLLHVLQI